MSETTDKVVMWSHLGVSVLMLLLMIYVAMKTYRASEAINDLVARVNKIW